MRREAKAGGAFEAGVKHRSTASAGNGLPGPFGRLNISTGKLAASVGLLGCLAVAAIGSVPAATEAAAAAEAGSVTTVTADGRTDSIAMANRSKERVAVVPTPAATKKAAAAATKTKTKAKAKAKTTPVTVAGLDAKQTANAKAIVEAAQDMGLPKKAMIIALSTAMQESNLYNLGSTVLAESQTVPNEGLGSDHDSVGLFQQRSSSGWGPVKKLMEPKFAATQFYKGLVNVPGWQGMAVTRAAQAVQVSAFPDAYAKHEGNATAVVNALTR